MSKGLLLPNTGLPPDLPPRPRLLVQVGQQQGGRRCPNLRWIAALPSRDRADFWETTLARESRISRCDPLGVVSVSMLWRSNAVNSIRVLRGHKWFAAVLENLLTLRAGNRFESCDYCW